MPTGGLRERKKRETRAALRSAALRLTAERGLDHVTVDDIAASADVSTRTFFNYFSTKEEAIVGSDAELMTHVLAVLAARPVDEEPLYSLEAVLQEFATLLVDAQDEYIVRRKVIADHPVLSSRHVAAFTDFERVLVDAIRQRTSTDPASSAEAALVVATAVAAMRVCVDQWVAREGDGDLVALLHSAINPHATGFGPASARPDAPSRGPARKAMRKDLR
jgi:AcrR family transcriptional regulator